LPRSQCPLPFRE